MNRGIGRARIERAARIYTTNQDAAWVLGISLRSFARLCRRYEIETPWARKRRMRARRTLSE